ncbi:hypothetical protein [Microbacterium hominis]|uniref:Uncharacterized protein n=1 Tax=Microbacterium hominis TaxID=162426 RepID=A0A7D4PK48_9MICO|nr:hypothetical protein [Microbacterium hominis]QKJ18030.1 hypothetical protein HQM25_00425 [Microbacterium hominis]
MDPLWAMIAEFWWVGPVAAGAGTLGFFGLRYQRGLDARRLEYDAARLELHDARARAAGARMSAKVARAELARLQAERAAARATPDQVASARQDLSAAQREVKAATASVRVQRTHVTAARAAVPATTDPTQLPLARTVAAHDAVTARWLEYETDPARRIAFSAMSDGRQPATAALAAAHAEAARLRPASTRLRMTPAEFAAYRAAVSRLEHAFHTAEAEAWRQARAEGTVPVGAAGPSDPRPQTPAVDWSAVAQEVLARSTDALTRAAETAAAAMAARTGESTKRQDASAAPPPTPEPAPRPPRQTPSRGPNPVWPVPSRSHDGRTT